MERALDPTPNPEGPNTDGPNTDGPDTDGPNGHAAGRVGLRDGGSRRDGMRDDGVLDEVTGDPPTASAFESHGRQSPRRKTKTRLAFFKAVEHLCRVMGGRWFYRTMFLRAGRFHERREEILVPDLAPGLDGFTIAHLSDMHAGSFLGPGDLADVVRRVNELEVDAVALTGDYITDDPNEAFLLTDDLGQLRSRHGTFAVFGNHDYRDRRESDIVTAYGERGIRFLRNSGERIDTGDGTLAMIGVEDLEEAKIINCVSARAALEPGDFEVLLCHNPGGAEAFARPGCVVVLSGHTHGRQIDLPILRHLGPRHPGERLQFGQTTSIVSRGLGVIGVPFRYGAPAELVVVKLKRAAEC